MINPFELKKGTLKEQVQFLNDNYYLEDAIVYKELHEKINEVKIELDLLKQVLFVEVNFRKSKRALLNTYNNCRRDIIDKLDISEMLDSCSADDVCILDNRIELHQSLRKQKKIQLKYYKEKLDVLIASFVEGQNKAKTIKRLNNMTAALIKKGENPKDNAKWLELSLEFNMRKFN